jgi:hypothetical protein
MARVKSSVLILATPFSTIAWGVGLQYSFGRDEMQEKR